MVFDLRPAVISHNRLPASSVSPNMRNAKAGIVREETIDQPIIVLLAGGWEVADVGRFLNRSNIYRFRDRFG